MSNNPRPTIDEIPNAESSNNNAINNNDSSQVRNTEISAQDR